MKTINLLLVAALLVAGCARSGSPVPASAAAGGMSSERGVASSNGLESSGGPAVLHLERSSQRVGSNGAPATAPIVENTIRLPSIDHAIADGVAFQLKSQQPDGSWGTGLETRGTEIYSMVPGSHDAYRIATSALCVMALREAIAAGANGEAIKDAHERGVRYLVENGDARRDDGSIIYNIWAHTYALQAISDELESKPNDSALASAAREQMDRMHRYATYAGGWNYYDFNAQTRMPSLMATSFGTAAGLVALYE